MPGAITVESTGPGSTIQDGGRFGYLRFGVTAAGPMDWAAFRTANLVLGNEAEAAAIEVGPGGLVLSVDEDMSIAFAGGAFAWTRDRQTLPPAARILLRPGEKLRARSGDWGAFAYCAVPGGIDVPPVLDSRATHTRSALGGLDGRGLQAGDQLPTAGPSRELDDVGIDTSCFGRSSDPIRVVLGPQDDYFSDLTIEAFQQAAYKVTAAADRMAYKFEGPKLNHTKDFNIVSDGIALGAIQVAGDGQPMVLMADRQPTGGYAKIAHVCHADIGRVAQMRPGDTCRFQAVSVEEARRALLDLEDLVPARTKRLAPLRRTPTIDRLLQSNLIGGVVSGQEE